MMTKHMKHKGQPLEKPSIAFRVRARGKSYLEWANDVCEYHATAANHVTCR